MNKKVITTSFDNGKVEIRRDEEGEVYIYIEGGKTSNRQKVGDLPFPITFYQTRYNGFTDGNLTGCLSPRGLSSTSKCRTNWLTWILLSINTAALGGILLTLLL